MKNIYLCDFAKTEVPAKFSLEPCIARVQASVAGKNQGACCLAGCQQRAQDQPIRRWVASLFCVKTREVGRGDFATLTRLSCQKAAQSQRIFPVG